MHALLLLLSAANAVAAITTISACSTVMGTTPVATVPTTTEHFTRRPVWTIHVTSTPTTTITPAPVTSTSTVTTTSTQIVDTQTTDTFTSTSTYTSTETDAASTTITSTVSTTTTTTTSTTTTVATAAGFTAIAYQADYQARKRSEDRAEGGARLPLAKAIADRAASRPLHAAFPAVGATTTAHYPAAVTCAYITRIPKYTTVTSIATSTVSVTLPVVTSSTTVTASTSTTSTSTLADATSLTVSTVTQSTTTTQTTTFSTTSTVTNTASVPVATFYAQCASSNLISHAHGQPVGQVSYSSAFTLVQQTVSDTSGYGCCVQCAQTPSCAGFGQYPGGACYYLLTSGQCDGSQTWGDQYHYFSTNGGFSYVVGNGACGALAATAGQVFST